MSRIHTRGYVPDGEDAYTSVIPWWHLPLMLFGLGALCVPIAVGTPIPTLVAAVVIGALAVAGTVLLAAALGPSRCAHGHRPARRLLRHAAQPMCRSVWFAVRQD